MTLVLPEKLQSKMSAMLVAGLLLTPEDELEKFLASKVQAAGVDLACLRQTRRLLQELGRVLLEENEARRERVQQAYQLVCDGEEAPAPKLAAAAAEPAAGKPAPAGESQPPRLGAAAEAEPPRAEPAKEKKAAAPAAEEPSPPPPPALVERPATPLPPAGGLTAKLPAPPPVAPPPATPPPATASSPWAAGSPPAPLPVPPPAEVSKLEPGLARFQPDTTQEADLGAITSERDRRLKAEGVLPFPQAAAKVTQEETMNGDLLVKSVLPFGASPLPFAQKPKPAAGAAEGEGEISLPPQLASIPLETYVRICAECTQYPSWIADIRSRYGIKDAAEHQALDKHWQARLAADPKLAEAYRWHYQQYEQWAKSQRQE